jgi:hypothetical protein
MTFVFLNKANGLVGWRRNRRLAFGVAPLSLVEANVDARIYTVFNKDL